MIEDNSAIGIRRRIAAGALSAEAAVRQAFERIDKREAVLQAWVALAREPAIAAARALDRGPDTGLLHGVPIGIKDIMATHDLPTRCGSPIYRDWQPPHDAAVVALARRAGALVVGKTVTTEFAYFGAGPTVNPHDAARTPGGSSSGSAAAVGAGMVPLATGTQTAGSIVRPAAFCGIVGYKPSFGLIDPAGVKPLAVTLDTIGVLGASVADVALFVEAVTGLDLRAAAERADRPRRIGLCRSPAWDAASAEMQAAFLSLPGRLAGAELVECELPAEVAAVLAAQKRIMAFEAAHALAYEADAQWPRLSPKLQELLTEGRATSRADYARDRALVPRLAAALDAIFAGVDVLISPSAAGVAPLREAGTGDPLFNRLWTLAGTPAINVPGLRDPAGLPLGVQVVAPVGRDAAAIEAAAWLEKRLAG
ncbi:MAG: Aspartyl-tRNA(Asn) amidotransferase subunit Glutamyl-tRNA(Gln) amidotransferase subunit [Rhodospirillales bacterium]|nr:Aspartyl-tRNA(Asn) amidotransferase subunit Glutamyl-tRNA(Gln) amidotransferase subunit [Rhodospirillales bacterium]